ncbi:TadE/TadG family type IV pilus assembly protein [Sandarakinorhabdus oryzae]|uniref:TadE/TadG family type IV pilus assembly protein n=1 Tax=Sandarakinorhabdus oryzae TaxID=2675220 RepID=UPI0012E3146D|nr:TadE/TadG family type IV pilus assembly protein [Sandarakinorhabdus oryzae]
MRRALTRLGRSRRGGAAAEMALIAPVLGSLLFVGMDLALAFWQKLQLEQAAQRGVELAVAPGTTTTNGDYSYLSTEVQTAYGKPVKSVTVTNWLECNGVRQASWSSFCPAGQTFARYVSVQVQADYVPWYSFGGVMKGTGSNGAYVLTGDAAVRLQ